MNLNSILGFISLAGWVAVIAGAGLAISNASQRHSPQSGIALAVVGLIVGILFFVASLGLVTVGATEVAVVFQSIGGDPATNSLWPTPLKPGVHIIVPVINEPFTYSTEVRNYTMSRTSNEGAKSGDDSVAVRTSDGQQVYIDVSILYRIDPDKANLIHLKYRDRYEEDFVRPTVRAITRDVISGYKVEELYGEKRTEVQQKVHDAVVAKFVDSGLEMRDLLLRNITFSDEFIKAVESKQVAAQQVEQAKQEAEKARTLAKGQADAAVTAAQGEADANVAKAKGDAQAIELRADADAKALALINEQLKGNPQLIQWRYIEKLAGDIRMVLVPSNSPFLFNFDSLSNQPQPSPTTSSSLQPTPTPQPTNP